MTPLMEAVAAVERVLVPVVDLVQEAALAEVVLEARCHLLDQKV